MNKILKKNLKWVILVFVVLFVTIFVGYVVSDTMKNKKPKTKVDNSLIRRVDANGNPIDDKYKTDTTVYAELSSSESYAIKTEKELDTLSFIKTLDFSPKTAIKFDDANYGSEIGVEIVSKKFRISKDRISHLINFVDEPISIRVLGNSKTNSSHIIYILNKKGTLYKFDDENIEKVVDNDYSKHITQINIDDVKEIAINNNYYSEDYENVNLYIKTNNNGIYYLYKDTVVNSNKMNNIKLSSNVYLSNESDLYKLNKSAKLEVNEFKPIKYGNKVIYASSVFDCDNDIVFISNDGNMLYINNNKLYRYTTKKVKSITYVESNNTVKIVFENSTSLLLDLSNSKNIFVNNKIYYKE